MELVFEIIFKFDYSFSTSTGFIPLILRQSSLCFINTFSLLKQDCFVKVVYSTTFTKPFFCFFFVS